MLVCIIYIILLLPYVICGICPVTSFMLLNKSSNFFYPLDIYAPPLVYEAARTRNDLFNCSAFDRLAEMRSRQHFCSFNHHFCPVEHQNVIDATMLSVNKRSSLCHLKPKLSDKRRHIRIFVMGGSSTLGSKAGGCSMASLDLLASPSCTWPQHFGQWLKSYASAKVTLYNLAVGGHNSYLRSRTFPDDLIRLKIPSFTKDDVIFVDHSINDNVARQSEIERGVESLIRRIYSLSKNNSWPSIVLLDADAQMCHRPRVKGALTLLYPQVYEGMARYYNLTVWSYRRAVWSNYSLTVQRNYSDFINLNNNHCDIHPTWHVHLFTADLYAAILQTTLSQCSSSQVQAAVSLHSQPLRVPPPLKLLQTHTECTTKFDPFISFSYDDVRNNQSLLGSYRVSPVGSWQLKEDKRGSGGLIVELKNVNESLKHAASARSSLIFTSSVSTEVMMKTKHKLVNVQILYLRSYENAGVVAVYFCGERHERPMDALWKDYQTNRISIPEIREGLVSLKACLSNNFTFPTVEFVHQPVWGELDVRRSQKFKLISIKMCREQ